MAKQALFYERAVPVSPQRHQSWSINPAVNYDFARHVNSVPLMTVEMMTAAREYTIVFAGNDKAIQPIVLLGVENNSNVYVNDDGTWAAHYVPAFVRRYPFVFSQNAPDANTFTLCIDEGWGGCNQAGQGEKLFDDQGKGTPYLEKMFEFSKEFQRQAQRTVDFGNKLKSLDLLDANTLQFTLPGGQKRGLSGFMIVNPEKLKALSGDALKELVQNDGLALIYTHLLSMNNLSLMFEKVIKHSTPAAPPTPA